MLLNPHLRSSNLITKPSLCRSQFRFLATQAKPKKPLRFRPWRPPVYPRVPSKIPSFAEVPYKTYKIRNKILAGGKNILFGHSVSKFKNRTPRVWRPNIKVKSLWSEILGRRIRLRVVTSVLRTIDKDGGLDAYLLGSGKTRMKELGPRGWEIRAVLIRRTKKLERDGLMRMFQRSLLMCPQLKLGMEFKDIRPFVKHTEWYAALPEHDCKLAFYSLMKALNPGRLKAQRAGKRRALRRRVKPAVVVRVSKNIRRMIRRRKIEARLERVKETGIKLKRRRKEMFS